MDDLIQDFLAETKEGIDALDSDLLQLEKHPDDQALLGNIFRVMHTIKGTCGFLDLQRLVKVAHAGENILDKMRDGKVTATPEVISLVLACIDQIKMLTTAIEAEGKEPKGDDAELIAKVNACAEGGAASAVAEQTLVTQEMPEAEGGAQDSDELQALFDATEPLVAKDVLLEGDADIVLKEVDAGAQDSDELQALFDATEALVDIHPEDTKAEVAAEIEAKSPTLAQEEKKDTTKAAQAKTATQTIRVSLDVLDHLMQQASELVLTRNQLLQLVRVKEDQDFAGPLQRLNYITAELQDGVMKTRMQPISAAWAPLPRIIRDLAMELDKEIALKMIGEDTELDRQLLEYIKDPLTHMVRNSADHGLETPEERKAAQKPEQGVVELCAYHEGGYIHIKISDDGRGLNPEKIRQKIIEKQLVTEDELLALDDKQIYQYIFHAGFSTAEKVTAVSGRGVGMDVVRTNIENIGGAIELDSTPGKGSSFTIKIPLTLAIMPVLIVGAKSQRFAIPQINILEVVKTSTLTPEGVKIEVLDEYPVLRLRGQILPLIYLSDTLKLRHTDEEKQAAQFVVICEIAGSSYGVIVDKVYDTEEIVVKPLSLHLRNIEVYSGITILGDGSTVLILDPNGMARTVSDKLLGSKRAAIAAKDEIAPQDVAQFVMFKAGDTTPKVIPLELVSRLEELDAEKIEMSHGQPVIQYREQLMYLVQLADKPLPKEGVVETLVVYSEQRIMGIIVDEIVDIVTAELMEDVHHDADGFMGAVVVSGKTCDIIDAEYYFLQLFKSVGGELGELSQNARTPPKSESKTGVFTVLFVDDSPFFRKFIPPEFEKAGFNVLLAKDGQNALETLKQKHDVIDVIVSDMNMPHLSGKELAEACQADDVLKTIPMVALSSHSEEDIALGEPLKGISAYVSKTDHAHLIESVNRALMEKVV